MYHTTVISKTWHRFHWGTTSKHQHKNCSLAACIDAFPASQKRGANASLNEQKNSKSTKLSAILPHLSQDTAHDVLQMFSMCVNQEQLLDNLLEQSRCGVPRQPDQTPTFVCDAINLTRITQKTFYQRDHLENGELTEHQSNPNGTNKRMMIPSKKHRKILKELCVLHRSSFAFIPHDKDAKIFQDYIRDSRPALHALLKFDVVEQKFRLHHDLLSLRELLRHWTCNNHETQLIPPTTARLLKPLLTKTTFTDEEYNNFIQQSPAPLTSLVDYGIRQQSIAGFSQSVLPTLIRDLLKFSIRLAIADTCVGVGNAAAFLE